MSEGQGEIAGRLVVPVESSTKGFRSKLKKKLEEASEGLAATVGIEVDDGDLRSTLEAKVKTASKGVKAKIGVDVDAKGLRAKLETIAAGGSNVDIGTSGGLSGEVAAETAQAQALADARPVRVPIKARAGLVASAMAEWFKARAVVGSKPIEVPVKARIRGRGLRMGIKVGVLGAILSLVQPAVGAIGQLIGGLTALVGAIAPATGAIAAIPIGLSAIIQGALGTKVALQGVGDAMGLLAEEQAALARGEELSTAQAEKLEQALSELSPSARKVAREVVGLRGKWTDMRKVVQERLFKQIAGDIEPLAEDLLPLLEKGLGRTAAVMGKNAAAAIAFMRTPLFQRQFSRIMAQNNRTIDAGADSLGGMAQGFLWFQRAAAPFQRRLDGVIRSFGEWVKVTSRENARNGDTAAFLEKAGDRLSQVWNITKQLAGGVAGIFRASETSGVRLLTMFETFVTKWHTWVDSTEGQARLEEWFNNVEKGFIELSRIVRDSFKAMAKWAEDPKIAQMLTTIRTELGPALNDLFTSLSDTFGQNVIDLITELARAIENLEPALEIVADMTGVLVDFLGVLNDLAESGGGATDAILKVAGALLVMRTGSRLLFGKGGRAGGGMLGRGAGLLGLLGLAGGGKDAKTIGAAAASTGKLGGALQKFRGLSFLKKAGIAGGVLSAVDLGVMVRDYFTAGERLGARLGEGFEGGVKSRQKSVAASMKDLLNFGEDGFGPDVFGAEDQDNWADKFGINRERLEAEIAKYGNTGDYYQDVMRKLRRKVEDSSANPFYGLPFVDTARENAKQLLDGFEQVADATQVQIDKMRDQRQTLKMLLKPLSGQKQPTEFNGRGGFSGLYSAGMDKDLNKYEAGARRAAAIRKKLTQVLTKPIAGVKGIMPGVTQSLDNINAKTDATRRKTQGLGGVIKGAVKSAVKGFSGIDKTAAQAEGRATKAGRNITGSAQQAKTASSRAFDMIPQIAAKSMKQTKGEAEKGMTGVIGAIKSAAGKARSAATTVVNNTKAPFQGLAGPMSSAGTAAGQGFTNGLESAGRVAVERARQIALDVTAAIRNAMNIRSPSRVTHKLGVYVGQGFANGIAASAQAVQRAQATLLKKLMDAGWSQTARRKFEDQTNREFRRLEDAARRRDKIAEKLERAKKRLDGLRNDRSTVREAFKSSAESFASISGISDANGGFMTPQSLIAELSRRVADAREFRQGLKTLRKNGLGKAAYKQIAEAGIEAGLPMVQQLLGADPDELKRINRLQNKMKDLGAALGKDASESLYNAGIRAADGLVKGLSKREKALAKAARRMATVLVKEVKRALKIKSPSQVMAGIGDDTIDGVNVGMLRRQARLTKTARKISADLARDMNTSSHAETLFGSTRKSARWGGRRVANMSSAPLVGELNINGKPEDVPDLLEEAMFALRRIRQGGVHARRTA